MPTSTEERWNPLRLVETLNFFGEIPFVGNFRWLQEMLGAEPNPPAPTADDLTPERVVVLWGAEGADTDIVGKTLVEHGILTRSHLIPSITPLPDRPANRIVNAHAVVWVGREGDAPQLTEQVDTLKPLPASEAVELLDFRAATSEQVEEVWGAVDDVVMGGVSASGLSLLPGFGRFSGTVSTANSGGFASIRTRNFDPPFNLTDWQGVRLVLRGDGQRYKVILRNSENWDSLAYCTSVDTEDDQWIGVDMPFSAFVPTFRARTQPNATPLDPGTVSSFQLMLSKFEYDGDKNPYFRPGAFSLDVRSIGAYRMVSLPPLIAIAPNAEQAHAYTEQLAQSGLSHRVIDRSDEHNFSTALKQALSV